MEAIAVDARPVLPPEKPADHKPLVVNENQHIEDLNTPDPVQQAAPADSDLPDEYLPDEYVPSINLGGGAVDPDVPPIGTPNTKVSNYTNTSVSGSNAYSEITTGEIVLGKKFHPVPFQNFIHKLNQHMIEKCGFNNGYFEIPGAITEPIPLTEHEQEFIKFVDGTDANGRIKIKAPHNGFINGRMFGKIPCYTFYMNVGNELHQFHFIAQNPESKYKKTTYNKDGSVKNAAGDLKWTALEVLAGKPLSWVIDKGAAPYRENIWKAKLRHVGAPYCVLNKNN